MSARRVLVTGGAGFIGSHLVDRILARDIDQEVHVVDSLWTGLEENLSHLSDHPQLRQLWTMRVEDMSYSLLGWFDEIYHLSSPASPRHYLPQPVATLTANLIGAMRCTELLRSGGLLCFTSTSEVYGDPLVSPQPERYWGHVNPIGPRACYDESKRATETYLTSWRREQMQMGLPPMRLKIARIFNCYGPRTRPDDGRAVSNFITAALQGRPVQVYGDGSQTRCFGYVDDIVEGLCRLFWTTPDEFCGPLNIGSDRETTVLDIARFVSDMLGGRIEHADPMVDDPQQRWPDLSLARQMIPGWECRVPYEDGVMHTVEWFREEL